MTNTHASPLLDDFISLTKSMSKQTLIEELARRSLDCARIQAQLDRPHDPGNSDWRHTARAAMRYKQVERDYLQSILSLTTADRFVTVASQLLDQDTFNIIMEQAQ